MSEKFSENGKRDLVRRFGLVRVLVALLLSVGGIITAYHTTIYGLKSEIADKAESLSVSQVEARLVRIETLLTETVASRAELLELRDELNSRLTAIEAKLQVKP